MVAATLRGLSNDVYFTVGLITIIGLAAKDAILIIEFAKDLRAQGKPLVEATIEACSLRFRPILMTGLAFVCGVLPMAIATGAGGGMRAKSIIGEKPIGLPCGSGGLGPPCPGTGGGICRCKSRGDAPGGSWRCKSRGEAPGGKFGQNICCAIDGGPLGWGWPVGSSIRASVWGDCSTPSSFGTQP